MALKNTNKTDTNTYVLEITVDGDAFKKAIDKVYRKQVKNINIHGFRKGKAPKAVIEKMYGKEVFYDDAMQECYPEALEAAVKEADLKLVAVDALEAVEAGDEGFTFKATIIVEPEITIEGYKGIEFEKKSTEVTEDHINDEIEKVRDRNSRMVTVDNRAAENGDVVVIDFEGFVDGEAFDGGKAENYNLKLGAGQFIPGFEEQICGHNTDEEFSINVKFPEDYQAEDLAGKDAEFKIKLHEIKTKELPEVNDDFVKDVSEFDTLDEYKADIKSKLEKAAADEASTNLDNALVDAVIAKMTAEVPQVMYQRRIDDIVREWSARNRIRIEDYLKYTGATMDQFRANFTEVAKRQVDLRLALEKIAELENITVTDEDLEKEYADMAEQYKMDVDKVKAAVPADAVKNDLRIEKALDLVRLR